ncbi:MAG: tetratricopeptide repeat protein, partial [Rhodothermales bacterium]|nr:tetratricopeptide repeat protein [Rhodothermales bacterium]
YDEFADLYTVRGEYGLAEAVYRRLLALKPGDQQARRDIGELRAKAKDYDGARKEYRQALMDGPATPEIYHWIAQTYLDENRPADAADSYREGIARFGTDRSLFVAWGRVVEDMEPAEAVQVYEQMMGARPSDPYPHVRLGVVFAEIQSARDTSDRQFDEAIRLGTNDPLAFHHLAESAALDGDTAGAIDYERNAVRLALQQAEKLKSRLLAGMGGGIQSLSQSELAGIETSADSLRRVEQTLRKSLGHLLSLGRTSDRETDLRELEDTFDEVGILLEYRGRLLEQAGFVDEAEATYVELLALEPENQFAQLALARIWEDGGDAGRAVAAYRRALVLDEQNQAIYEKLIELYTQEDNLEILMDDWLIEARRSPGNRVLLENLAELLEAKGRQSDLEYVQTLLNYLDEYE